MKKVEKILGREKFVNKKYCGKILNLKKVLHYALPQTR